MGYSNENQHFIVHECFNELPFFSTKDDHDRKILPIEFYKSAILNI